jgi:phosphoribosylformylglycinamidine cyclo-ligase
MPRSEAYKRAGVDIDAGDDLVDRIAPMVRRTQTPRVLGAFGLFAGLFSLDYRERVLRRNYRDPVLAACTDGVGTKLRLAFMMRQYRTVGIDLVAMNVNDLITCGAEPLFFLDYLATGHLDPAVGADLVAGIAEGCMEAECALLGGETAEMPGFYKKGDYDLAGFAVGVVERRRIIDGRSIVPGDQLIGLPSSGVHSNGYSLVRRIVFDQQKMKPDTPVPELGTTVGAALLTPTRIYVRPILRLLNAYRVKRIVKGLAHITGGGLTENVPRILPEGCAAVIDRATWTVPPIFGLLARWGGVDEAEMFRVFNMGIGLVLAVPPYYANAVLRRLERLGEQPCLIGTVRRGRPEVIYE